MVKSIIIFSFNVITPLQWWLIISLESHVSVNFFYGSKNSFYLFKLLLDADFAFTCHPESNSLPTVKDQNTNQSYQNCFKTRQQLKISNKSKLKDNKSTFIVNICNYSCTNIFTITLVLYTLCMCVLVLL